MIDENKRIECPHCRSKFVIGKFFTHREICCNLSVSERNRQNNSRIRRRGGVGNNAQRNQEDEIPAAQPCSAFQPEQQLRAQQEEETEWENVMKEIDENFSDSVEAPRAAQQNRVAPREKWRNMSGNASTEKTSWPRSLGMYLLSQCISESRRMRCSYAYLCCQAL